VDAELATVTSSLAEQELARLLAEDEDADFSATTVLLDASELDVLLAQSRPVPAPPPARPQLTTQPYDEVTASALLDNDADSPQAAETLEPEAVLDEDELEAVEAVVKTEQGAPVIAAEPVVAPPTVEVVAPPEPSAPASTSIPPAGPPFASPPASAPVPIALPPTATRASFPSAGLEWPGAKERKRRAITILAIVAALAGITILYLAFAESDPAPTAPLPAAAAEPASPAPAPSAPRAQSPAEIDARKALGRLRDGMGDCVRHAIGSLPGSSPAVPPALKLAGGAGYTALPADWKTAVWSCARFRHDTPMQFQLQWQSIKPGVEALGIAWIDDDGDGDADRALGFRATAKGAHDVELGDVAPLEMRPVLPVR
jgi:hypothetical protein